MARRIDKIREAGNDELLVQERELTEQIFRLRFQLSTGQAEALKRLRDARKDLARVKTHLRAQELNGTAGSKNGTEKSAEKAAEKTAAAPVKHAAAKTSAAAKPAKKPAERTSKTKKAGKA
ncbi:MAG TPA: 50S ribosomal protein L29 [Verrucomicrobiae bacterium]|jgi:large subunit ribosomal protein L29|nr:50S ribosomal protein L29 [Verrucomicrobiae bacterium]